MESLLIDAGRLDAARAERERLQGTWNFISGTREAQLLIDGDEFTVCFKNGDTYRGTIALDPIARPKRLDMMIAEGPERHRGKTARCIYALDANRLLWAAAKPGEEEAPKFFPPPEDKEHAHIVFERAKRKASEPEA
jgi:uncharacterized protein (TIGR03067 family)